MISLIFCNYLPHTLIVLPPILIDQWYIQIYRTTGKKPLIYYGEAKKDITLEKLNEASVVITSYGAITLTAKQLQEKKITLIHGVNWSRIIFDEAHHLRNNNTSLYTSARILKADIRWLVSGTPIQNRKNDFYSLCALLRFLASFYTDTTNLLTHAKSFILKRTKKQVGIDIADLHIGINEVKWSNEMEMLLSEEIHSALSFSKVNSDKHADGAIIDALQIGKGHLPIIMRAKQSCIFPKLMTKHLDKLVDQGVLTDYDSYKEAFDSSSKLDAVCASILKRKDNGCGKIIFCHYREEIDEVASRLRNGGMLKVATIDGRTSSSKRSEALMERNDALILQIQTGCEGLNLQENYSEIYFIAPHWNPAIEDQAIARCHRIGQTKPVYVQRFEMCKFVSEDDEGVEPINIDKYVNVIQDIKRTVASQIIG